MRPFLIAFLLVVGLLACRKDTQLIVTTNPSLPNGNEPDSVKKIPSFKIKNVIDRVIYHQPFSGTPGAVWFLDIEKEPDSTLPMSLEIVHTNRFFNAGTTEYSNGTWTMAVYDSSAVNGIYNFTLEAWTGSQPVVSYPFKVMVEGNLSCTGFLADILFNACGYTPAVTNYPNMRFQKSVTDSDTLLLTGFRNYKTLKVIPNCRAERFLVPSQKIGDTTYSGTGAIMHDEQLRTTKIEFHILEESGNWAYIVEYIMNSK